MKYTEVEFFIDPASPETEILISWLGEEGFDGFMETETGFVGYVQENLFSVPKINSLVEKLHDSAKVSFIHHPLKEKNWNEVWENNFSPVIIADKCFVRAPFHERNPNYPFEIVIEPKMSFGTAHHETTSMMIEFMLIEHFEGKALLDMGCGTGILAIAACKLGAKNIVAIDNDKWAFENASENMLRNGCENIEILLGDAGAVGEQKFDMILANINRNILLEDMHVYADALASGGVLFISGFFESDLDILKQEASTRKLKFDRYISRNNWVAARFVKMQE